MTAFSTGRWLKERILSKPVVMTEPGFNCCHTSKGRNTAFSGANLTTKPMTLAVEFRAKCHDDVVNDTDFLTKWVKTEVPASFADIEFGARLFRRSECTVHPPVYPQSELLTRPRQGSSPTMAEYERGKV